MERFWSKVDKTDECWLWTAATVTGYGYFGVGRRGEGGVLAHRFSWELVNGPIPEGMQIDHRCHVRRCVNPAHLRLVTDKQNKENQRGAYRNSVSGVRGVSPHKNKWVVQVQHYGKNIYGGLFATIEEAEKAAVALRKRVFTHSDETVQNLNSSERKESK